MIYVVTYRNVFSRATFVLIGTDEVQARMGASWEEVSRRGA